MARDSKSLTLVAVLIVSVVQALSTKMGIWVYTGPSWYSPEWSMKYSYTQKCYTFNSCLAKKAIGASWNRISAAKAIVFYDKEDCQGTKLISHTFPWGKLMFPFKNGAKSFMVWSDGMYATRGISHECMERASINQTNTTASGSSAHAGDGFMQLSESGINV
ncbi:hypothetical protein PHMEG_0004288 [Phytophthora megakarya]|uniref:Uncharacterized protein n=1 Tax=Phytophthora megakarya TaxID=4795 RepID=A0A225WU69_9STRA|nr:hypothetical protein PHMEG_0004288 [Phytophthora megakarya]